LCSLLAKTGRRLLMVLSMLNQNGAPRLSKAVLARIPQKERWGRIVDRKGSSLK
jgi:hypothetical protein